MYYVSNKVVQRGNLKIDLWSAYFDIYMGVTCVNLMEINAREKNIAKFC